MFSPSKSSFFYNGNFRFGHVCSSYSLRKYRKSDSETRPFQIQIENYLENGQWVNLWWNLNVVWDLKCIQKSRLIFVFFNKLNDGRATYAYLKKREIYIHIYI